MRVAVPVPSHILLLYYLLTYLLRTTSHSVIVQQVKQQYSTVSRHQMMRHKRDFGFTGLKRRLLKKCTVRKFAEWCLLHLVPREKGIHISQKIQNQKRIWCILFVSWWMFLAFTIIGTFPTLFPLLSFIGRETWRIQCFLKQPVGDRVRQVVQCVPGC